MNPNEARQHAYLQLVQALLTCPPHLEQQLLELNPELVDMGLVMTLLAVAQSTSEQDDRQSILMSEWLVNFAQQLAQKLGLDMEATIELRNTLAQSDRYHPDIYASENSTPSPNPEYTEFFLDLLQSVVNSQGNRRIVHKFFDDHLSYLDEKLLANLPQQVEILLAHKDESDWKYIVASTLNNLAIDLYQFYRGNRAINLELAIECYRLALEVYTRAAYPEQWAMTQMNLAVAYSSRIRGERAANLEQSIECYQLALEVYTRPHYPQDWARTQMNLANAYSDRIRGERAANLEKSIECYQLALEVYTRPHYPQDWARTQMNLAGAYSDRIRGERAANLEKSIECYQLALEVFFREAYPEGWARTQMNLAVAYRNRIRGERAANLEQSIACYRLALEVFFREAYPEDWARTQMNLAGAYQSRIRGEWAANLEQSIACYELALKVRTRSAYPEDWAMTQMNLAVAYSDRIQGERAANLEQSIECYRLALEIFTRSTYPEQWARTQMNLAVAYQSRIRGEGATNLELSIDCSWLALEVYTPWAYPEQCLKTASNLGNLHYEIGNWQPAIHAYETAMQAVETSRSWVLNEESRQELLKDALSIYENAIQCAINLQNYPQAIQFTERIRSRRLIELIETTDLYADAQRPSEIAPYLAEYEDINRQIQSQRQQIQSQHQPSDPLGDNTTHPVSSDANDLAKLTAAITTLEHQKAEVYNKLRQLDPVLAGEIQVQTIDYAAIQQLITTPHTAILTCYTTDNDTHIFIIKHQGAPTIHTCKNEGWKQFQQWLQTEWIDFYAEDVKNWQENLPYGLKEISERLQLDTLITKHLTDINELIIVPHLNLHQIPFAALPIAPFQADTGAQTNPLQVGVNPEGRGGCGVPVDKGEFFLSDRFLIRSIPSCQILQYCKNRPTVTTAIFGTVEDAEDNLLGARVEGAQIAALYNIPPTNRLIGSQATPANYRALLSRVNRLHSSHNAISRRDSPLESALILAQGDRITLSDLLIGTRYPHLDEVFLSVSESSVGTTTTTDDIATLATGFLCIGARSVQSTLWAVNDIITVIFSLFYHQQRNQSKNPTISLRTAQQQLRNLTGEQFAQYQPIIESHRLPAIAALDDRIAQLITQQSTLDLDAQKGAWDELQANIEELKLKLRNLDDIYWDSQDYCDRDRPFEHPFYWAGFITQGMA
jgi:CHAT domain-containing protein